MLRVLGIAMIGLVACPSTAGDIGVAREKNILTFAVNRDVAPAIEGEMLSGEPVEPAGRVAVVNFWGSWCGPCRQEQPHLEALWKRFRGEGVVFIGINSRRDNRASALAFLDEFNVTYPSIYDPASTLAAAFGVRFMPATYVLDPFGGVAALVTGALSAPDDLAGVIERELA